MLNSAPSYPFTMNTASPQAKCLVGWWPMLGNFGSNSLPGRAYPLNGTLNGASWASDVMGASLEFPKSGNNRVDIPHRGVLTFPDGDPITISAWINPDTISNFDNVLVKATTTDSGNYYFNLYTTGKLEFTYYALAGWQTIRANNNEYTTGQWTHIAVTYIFGAGSSAQMYVNGKNISASWAGGTTGDEAVVTNTEDLRIGNDPYDDRFDGKIGEIRLYRRYLSAGEIHQLYAPQTRWDLYQPVWRPALILPPSAAPTAYYVDSSATDDTGDGSIGNPKKYIRSIAELGTLNPGDTIYLRGGVSAGSRQSYTESDEITPTVSGTASQPITICNYPGEFVEILSPGAGLDTFLFNHGINYWTIDGEDEDYHILIDKELESQRALDIHGNGIIIRYCDIINGKYDQLIRFHGVTGGTTAPSILEYCHIHYGYDTIGASGGCNGVQIADACNGVTIRYCTINGFAGSGIHVLTVGSTSADTFNVVVQYCTAYNGVERDADLCEAFFDAKTSDGAIVEYCTMYGFRKSSSNPGHAMRFINYTANSVVRYNVIYDTSGSPYKCEVGDSEFYHNLIYDMYDADAGGPDNRIIHLRGSGTHKVYNNTIIGNGDAGGRALLRTDQTCDVVLKNNIFDNTPSTNSLASTGTITATNNAYGSGATVHWSDPSNVVESDLDFVDEGSDDYRINDTSPCLNAGTVQTPYTDGYHSSAPDIGYYEVPSIAYAGALSLGRAAALALAGGGQSEGATTLARVAVIALAGEAQGEGATTLARLAVIALAGEAQGEGALSLDRITALTPAGEAGAAGAISLARAGAITTVRIISIESAFSLAKVIAVTLAGDAQTEAGLTLAEIKALSADGGQGIEVALTVALALAISQAGDAQTDSALILDRIPAISPAGGAGAEGAAALARGATIVPAAGADAEGAIALGQAIAIAVLGGRDIQVVVVTLSLARSLDESMAGDKIADQRIDLSRALAAGLSGAADAEASAALNRVPALVPAGGADAASGLNLDRQTALTLIAIAGVAAGLEVGRVQALITAGARVGVVSSPPDNRIFTVGAEDRVFVVPAETRTFSVV